MAAASPIANGAPVMEPPQSPTSTAVNNLISQYSSKLGIRDDNADVPSKSSSVPDLTSPDLKENNVSNTCYEECMPVLTFHRS